MGLTDQNIFSDSAALLRIELLNLSDSKFHKHAPYVLVGKTHQNAILDTKYEIHLIIT